MQSERFVTYNMNCIFYCPGKGDGIYAAERYGIRNRRRRVYAQDGTRHFKPRSDPVAQSSALIKCEIALVVAPRREMSTELARISGSAQKRVIVTVCDSEQINLAFIEERITTATEFIAAVLHRDENGKLYATYEISQKARLFLHQPCRDLVDAMCAMINEEG